MKSSLPPDELWKFLCRNEGVIKGLDVIDQYNYLRLPKKGGLKSAVPVCTLSNGQNVGKQVSTCLET